MTTEIAILNRSAVALATDSAVTISTQQGDETQINKIYANANKLFELVRGAPVGLMIYNSANIGGIPWETLVKVYRQTARATKRSALTDYAADFLDFVVETVRVNLDEAQQRSEVLQLVATIAEALLRSAEPQTRALSGAVKRRQYLRRGVETVTNRVRAEPLADWAAGINEEKLWTDLKVDLVKLVAARWCDASLSLDLRTRLARLSLAILLRSSTPYGPWTGVVVAGFGEDELFPSLHHVLVGGIAFGQLVRLQSETERVTVERPAIIQPYAQTDEAVMFLQGVDPEVSAGISSFWQDWALRISTDFAKIAAETFKPADDDLQTFENQIGEYMEESWRSFGDFMDNQYHRPRMEPIEASASFLSKGEIADLAENLVELTSLRNRVSLNRQETVGGATDVAVISRGDGFIWLKRKHYFDHDRNPTWALRQALADVSWARHSGPEGGG